MEASEIEIDDEKHLQEGKQVGVDLALRDALGLQKDCPTTRGSTVLQINCSLRLTIRKLSSECRQMMHTLSGKHLLVVYARKLWFRWV